MVQSPPPSLDSERSKKIQFIGLRDLVFSVLMSVIMLVAALIIVIPFAANMQLLYFVEPGIVGLVWGVLMIVVMAKTQKTGAIFIPFLTYGLYMLSAGSPYPALLFVLTGFLSELIMLGGGFKSKVRRIFPPVLMTLSNAMGGTLTMLFFRDSMVQTYMSMGLDAAGADAALAAVEAFWLAPESIAIAFTGAVVGALIGYFIGIKLMKKHFRPSGAV